MKKTLIAASIAALATAGSAQAVELYKSDTASFSTYGKLQLELQNFDGENNIQNQGSRFGFSGTQALDSGLEAFANFEFRFQPGLENDTDMTVRDSYFGVRGELGSIKAGNFDSVVYSKVTGIADVMENVGYRSLDAGENNARATALAIESAEMGGLQFAVGIKHYASDKSAYAGAGAPLESSDGGEQWNLQFAATYALTDELVLAFGVDQNNEDGNAAGNGKDPIIAFGATYGTDAFSAGAVVESNDKDMIFNLVGSFNYGAGDVYGIVSFRDDDVTSGVDFGLGANYSMASNFYVYGEFAQGNKKNSDIGDLAVVTLGASYSW